MSSRSGPVPAAKTERSIRSTSRPATVSSSESGPGTEIKIDGEELMIMKESDVMGIVAGDAATAKKS